MFYAFRYLDTHFIELNHWLKEPLIFTADVELVVIVWVWVMLA